MNRMTKYLESGNATRSDCDIPCNKCFGGCKKAKDTMSHLAAYEDTGLEPEEIIELKARMEGVEK